MELITNEMYSKLPNLILGFHGCRKETYDELLKEKCQDNDLPKNKTGRSKTDLLLRNKKNKITS